MSRVDEALRRAAAAPRLVATGPQVPERPAERRDRPVLEHYPLEAGTSLPPSASPVAPVAPVSTVETRVTPAVGTEHAAGAISTRFSPAYQGKLVAVGGAPPASIEQYRRLAATLHHLQAEQGLKRLMVTSAAPQEGKTLTVVNLAITLSESYRRRVLLIDADLRRPSIHDVFGISNQYGLCDALRPGARPLQFSRVSPMLWVLPAGPTDANPMGALASDRMERLLDEVGSSFDWILLDAPPVALMADAGLLARLTRAVIVVIGAGSTPYALVEKVVAELGRENIIGTVMNRVEEDATQWSGYYSNYDGPREPTIPPQ
jgi:protein-tyrosine kinase